MNDETRLCVPVGTKLKACCDICGYSEDFVTKSTKYHDLHVDCHDILDENLGEGWNHDGCPNCSEEHAKSIRDGILEEKADMDRQIQREEEVS